MPNTTKKLKSFNKLAMEVISREGGKRNLNIAQINEVVGIMCDLSIEHPESIATLVLHGQYRSTLRDKGKPLATDVVESSENGCNDC